jgi:carboxylate-amine ligase
MAGPTVGVEEEFLLVDQETGEPVAKNEEVARNAEKRGVKLDLELTSCQVETNTSACSASDDLYQQITRLRRNTAEAAAQAGATLLAVGLPPTIPHSFPITDTPRYRQIGERFGMIAHEQGICGCHVHVEVPDREIAIKVSNRLRWWLPLLLAISSNSAIYRNADTGHASWRNVLWSRWPCAGPPPHLKSAAHYDEIVAMMVDADVLLDDGMVYWDVRPSAKFPTVEVRVADVPATAAQTVLVATLIRAAVMTAVAELRGGEVSPKIPDHVVRATYWKAARGGTSGSLIDPMNGFGVAPADQVLRRWLATLGPALRELGDDEWVPAELDRLLTQGNGSVRQRQAWRRGRSVADVIAESAAATLAGAT